MKLTNPKRLANTAMPITPHQSTPFALATAVGSPDAEMSFMIPHPKTINAKTIISIMTVFAMARVLVTTLLAAVFAPGTAAYAKSGNEKKLYVNNE